MYRAGLKDAELRAFHAALRSSHYGPPRILVLDMDGEVISDLSDDLEDGQVNIDTSGDRATRSATLSFVDKGRTYDFDSDSPSDGALFANRQVRVDYRIRVDALGRWVTVPLITGVVNKVDRADDVVNVEIQGREHLSTGTSTAWDPMTVKKGVPKVDAIRRIMRERGRTTRFDLPDLHARLPKAVSLGRMSSPWAVCQKIAESVNRQLYFDGAGILRLRNHPDNNVYTFSTGEDAEIMSPPQVSFNIDACFNTVWVKGGKPKAHRRKNETRAEFENRQDKERGVRWHAVAARNHPLSPWRLGTDDSPRYITREVDNDHVRSEKEARELAERMLRKGLMQHIDVTFDSLVIPHLEEDDLVKVSTDLFAMPFHLRQFSIPLKHDGLMSVGFTRKVSQSKRPAHRHDHPHRQLHRGGHAA